MLAAAEDPYVVVIGPPGWRPAWPRGCRRRRSPPMASSSPPARIDLGFGRAEVGGLRRGDIAIRDAHPALWLVRARARAREAGGVAVLPWSPADARDLLAAVVRDPLALVVTLPPLTGDPARDRETLARASLGPVRGRTAGLPLGVPAAALARAAFEAGGPGPDIALWMVAGLAPPPAYDTPALPGPGFPRRGYPEWVARGAPLPPPDLVLPWGGDPGPATRDRRRRELEAGLAACRFRDAAWFPALAAALADAEPGADAGDDPAPARRRRGPGARALMPRVRDVLLALAAAAAASPGSRSATAAPGGSSGRCSTAPPRSRPATSSSSPACATSGRGCRPSSTTTAGSGSGTSSSSTTARATG